MRTTTVRKYRVWIKLGVVSLSILLFCGTMTMPTVAEKAGGLEPRSAATVTVTNTNDSGAGSLRQAIADAISGDTINFNLTGTITLTSGQLVIDKNLTIQGPRASLLSISGNHASGVFSIDPLIAITLEGMTIRDGGRFVGGGILNQGALTVSNCTISGNGSESYGNYHDGGGIFNDFSGTLKLNSSTVSGNISSDYDGNSTGGGIHTAPRAHSGRRRHSAPRG